MTDLNSVRGAHRSTDPNALSDASALVPPRIHWNLCLLTLLCAAPTMALISREALGPARMYFFATLFAVLAYFTILQRPYHVGAMIVALTPLLMLMRVLLFHNSVSVILAIVVGVWLLLDFRNMLRIGRDPLVLALVALAFLYWWVSFAVTYEYASNFRIFELSLGAANVVLLARRRSFLGTAFIGLAVTTIAMAFGMSGFGEERMGLAEVKGQSLGTPGQLGIPSVLVLLLAASENGRWMLLDRVPILRFGVMGAAALTMLFAVHRTGWVLAVVGVCILFAANPRRQLKPMLTAIPLLIAMVGLALASDRGAVIEKYYWKVMDPGRSWNQKTTNRFHQWKMFPEILSSAPLLGHGPGAAREFDRRRDGVALTLHSSYLHIGAETGLVGLSLYLCILAGAFVRALQYRLVSGDATPLALLACMVVDGLSHNNFSPLLGIFLGVTLSANSMYGSFVFRRSSDVQHSQMPNGFATVSGR